GLKRLNFSIERLRLSPIQVVLLALSLPSTPGVTHKHGLEQLAGLYERHGATELAEKVRRQAGGATEAGDSPNSKAFRRLMTEGNPAAVLEALGTKPASRTGIDLTRDHPNPVLLGSLEVRSLGFPISVLELEPSAVKVPVVADVAERLESYAIEALALWFRA